jgi:hypothetical protein
MTDMRYQCPAYMLVSVNGDAGINIFYEFGWVFSAGDFTLGIHAR